MILVAAAVAAVLLTVNAGYDSRHWGWLYFSVPFARRLHSRVWRWPR